MAQWKATFILPLQFTSSKTSTMQQRYLCLTHWRFPHTCTSKGGWIRTHSGGETEGEAQAQPPVLAFCSGKLSRQPQKAQQQWRQVHTTPASQRQQRLSRQVTEWQRGFGPHPSGHWGTHNSGPLPHLPTPVEPTNLRKSDDHYQQWQSLQPRGFQTRGKSSSSQRTRS